MKRMICAIVTIALLLSGCGSASNSSRSTAEISGGPVLTDFGIRLLRECSEPGKNSLVSPYSVMTALAMTALGAENDTLAQMETVLGQSRDALNTFLGSYANHIARSGKAAVHTANAIWLREMEGFTVREEFLQENRTTYSTDVYPAPFDSSTLEDINRFVKKNTDGMIENILDQIPPDAVMYLVNALAFEAKWNTSYYSHQVRTGSFTTASGQVREVEMLRSEENQYLETDGAYGFIKYYEGKQFAFVALLPEEGCSPEELLASLSGKTLDKVLSKAQDITVHATIPKFESEFDSDLAQMLNRMGMTDAFDWRLADFTGIGQAPDGKNLCISRVLHKTYIAVGEEGTKAGAATSVEMRAEGASEPQEYRTVTLDRPFVYMIIDCTYRQPLFMGILADPVK